jgi:hypothetical protein
VIPTFKLAVYANLLKPSASKVQLLLDSVVVIGVEKRTRPAPQSLLDMSPSKRALLAKVMKTEEFQAPVAVASPPAQEAPPAPRKRTPNLF